MTVHWCPGDRPHFPGHQNQLTLMMLHAWGRQDPADAHDARFWRGLVAYTLRLGVRADPADAHDARFWWGLVAYTLRLGVRADPADAHDARFWWAQFAYFRKCGLVDSTQNPEPT